MDSNNINNNVIRGEHGKIYRFLPNVHKDGSILSAIVGHDFYFVKYKGENYYFADDQEFSLRENGLPPYVNDEKSIQINKVSKCFAYVLTEENKIKILRFGKIIADKIKNYKYSDKLLNPMNGIGLKMDIFDRQGYMDYSECHFVDDLEEYSIGDDNLTVTSFMLDSIPLFIDDYLKNRSWYRSHKRREIIQLLLHYNINDNLTEYLKKFNREDLIDGLLQERE